MSEDEPQRNEVLLVGRLGAAAQSREMPSGDTLVAFRVVVARPPAAPGSTARPRGPSVDSIDCVAWRAGVRRTALAWAPGDLVEVAGVLRRRFWKGGAGPQSRTEVEVVRARRLRRGS